MTTTLVDQSVNSVNNDQMSFAAVAGSCTGGLRVGGLDLGTSGFYNGGGSTKTAAFSSALTLANAGKTLIITLGVTTSNAVNQVGTAVTATYTPDTGLRSGTQVVGSTTATSSGVAF